MQLRKVKFNKEDLYLTSVVSFGMLNFGLARISDENYELYISVGNSQDGLIEQFRGRFKSVESSEKHCNRWLKDHVDNLVTW